MFNNKYQLGVKKNFFQCLLAVCLALFLPTAQAATMTVFAAASLTNAFNHLAQSFMQKYPQHQVVTSYAASDVLLQQIIHGAPAQVFAAADEYAMLLAEENKVRSEEHTSELQSRGHLVCRLLLEKKNNNTSSKI